MKHPKIFISPIANSLIVRRGYMIRASIFGTYTTTTGEKEIMNL